MRRQVGSTLAVGLMLLTLVTLLALAGASGAHVEQLLAQGEGFRENAASAASAGIEVALREIVNSSAPETVVAEVSGSLPEVGSYVVAIRFAGYDLALPQAPDAQLAAAHYEIVSTGKSARRAVDRQRASVVRVVAAPAPAGADCEPLAARRCAQAGELRRLSWQRMPPP